MFETIQILFNYNVWAQGRILEVLAEVSEEEFLRELPEGAGSIRNKLAHIMAAEDVWLQRIHKKDSPRMIQPPEIDSKEVLISKISQTHSELEKLISSLDETKLQEGYRYKNLKGQEFESKLFEILLHVLNHGTYHRGQVASLIRRIKGKPPVTDMIEFFRSK
ncbi:MAG: DinB family protein [Leptospiraceae bacterium]|nr:DinB family protein [Leptospiraceae bacterium]